NTFEGLLVHARDGEGFTLHNRGTADRPQLVHTNQAGEGGHAPYYRVPYLPFETALLGELTEINPKDVMPREDGKGPDKVKVLEAQLANARNDVAKINASLKRKYSENLVEVLRYHESRVEALAAELAEEKTSVAGGGAEGAWAKVPGLVDLLHAEGDAARLR